jgi:hypothetical protein
MTKPFCGKHLFTTTLCILTLLLAIVALPTAQIRAASYTPMVSAGVYTTVGLKTDGTVVAVGLNDRGQCDVSTWTDIIQVSTSGYHTVGLYSNGTLVAVGDNSSNECDIDLWTGITRISTASSYTVGLKSDGTVIAVGRDLDDQWMLSSWTDITQISANSYHTVGLKSDGTVVAAGRNDYGQCKVSLWTDITQVSAGAFHTVGLKSDGTVVAVGKGDVGQCDVNSWTGITQIAAAYEYTVGLKSDRTVGSWNKIIQILALFRHTVGLKSDGTVVADGWNLYGQCNVYDLNLEFATVDISVLLQGSQRPESSWVFPLTVKFITSGTDVMTVTPLYTFNLTTSKVGGSAIAQCRGVMPGNYDITALSEHTLLNVKRNVAITSPSISVNLGTLLEGNANNDDRVNILDFGILASAYGKGKGNPAYNPMADFDRNGIVNIFDFGLLATNYLKIAPIEGP